ncbi:MAG: peptide chain release factor N(5)-glutamine methyltransferase [Planctomycetota bacterium]
MSETGGRELRQLGDVLSWTIQRFQDLGIPSARLDAELLLAGSLGVERLDLYTSYHRPLDAAERARFRELIVRRSRKEPVAYLLGEREFFSLPFFVDSSVLIPRPESEHIVECALEKLKERESETLRVLDLGSGSGNLSISIAVNEPRARVDAVDISPDAIQTAKRNAERNEASERVTFHHGDLFDALTTGDAYDVIVSNPPYIRGDEMETLMPDVRLHEPELALVDTKSDDRDGLGFYHSIAAGARDRLRDGGWLIVEVGEGQAGQVSELFRRAGLGSVDTINDYGQIERVVIGQR